MITNQKICLWHISILVEYSGERQLMIEDYKRQMLYCMRTKIIDDLLYVLVNCRRLPHK